MSEVQPFRPLPHPEEENAPALPRAVPAIHATDDPPPAFQVEGVTLQAELGLIVGDGGVMKTSIACAIAAALASEEAVFDRFEVVQAGPVLIVSEEDGAGVFRNRLEALARGHGWDVEKVLRNIHILALKGATLDSTEWQDHIAAEAERIGAVLVILDPYAELTAKKENSTDETKPNIKFFRALNRMGITVLVIHHAGKHGEGKSKLDRVRGSSALNQAARFIYFLDRTDLGVAVECLKMSRAERPDRFVVAPEIETDAHTLTLWRSARLTYVTEDRAAEQEADRFLLHSLERYPYTNSTGLKELAKGTGIPAVEISAAIRRLSAVRKIEYRPGPRNAKEWYVTNPAEKPPATSARYPADPAESLPGKVAGAASPCPSSIEGGRVAGGAGESRQGHLLDPEEEAYLAAEREGMDE